MAWDLVGVKRESKDEADKLRREVKQKAGREPTFDEIFRRGLEDLKQDIELEEKKRNKDVMNVFR